jgi:hypothetical protein
MAGGVDLEERVLDPARKHNSFMTSVALTVHRSDNIEVEMYTT